MYISFQLALVAKRIQPLPPVTYQLLSARLALKLIDTRCRQQAWQPQEPRSAAALLVDVVGVLRTLVPVAFYSGLGPLDAAAMPTELSCDNGTVLVVDSPLERGVAYSSPTDHPEKLTSERLEDDRSSRDGERETERQTCRECNWGVREKHGKENDLAVAQADHLPSAPSNVMQWRR
ncbi:hypothetical protein EYF80_040101 [Liparis tanakae]|uniref:Uncharacterized protein n=1 Tax=Liparis tanakae TaxID=230148 RepID=A0A4Z2G801_9TELE|nr:hypothetical protein EYF80_040101 [Liparis tanakae]